jgi:hypothetical protein
MVVIRKFSMYVYPLAGKEGASVSQESKKERGKK